MLRVIMYTFSADYDVGCLTVSPGDQVIQLNDGEEKEPWMCVQTVVHHTVGFVPSNFTRPYSSAAGQIIPRSMPMAPSAGQIIPRSMPMAPSTTVYASLRGLQHNQCLNNQKVMIIEHPEYVSRTRMVVKLLTENALGRQYASVPRTTVFPISQQWLSSIRSHKFRQMDMLTHFQAPGCETPPTFDRFTQRLSSPGTDEVLGFWGAKVFIFMKQQMIRKLIESTWARGDWSYFQDHWGSWSAGIIFSDGTKQGQMAPGTVASSAHFWPVIYTHAHDEGVPALQLVTWCQDQAMNGAKPWRPHQSRVVRLNRATAEMNACSPNPERPCGCPFCRDIDGDGIVETPGLTFSEVDSDEDSPSTIDSSKWVVLQ